VGVPVVLFSHGFDGNRDLNPSAQDCETRAILGHPPNHRLSQNPFLTVQNRTRTTSVVLENEIF
jgi:hypothetical protein